MAIPRKAKSKGQASIFLVIGLVLLIAAGIFFYVKTASTPFKIFSDKPKTQVEFYVSQCLETTAKDGLHLLGTQSGYINISEQVWRNPFAHLTLDKYGLKRMPMWYYEGADHTPTDQEIETQLAGYIDSNIDTCLEGFAALRQQFDITELSRPRSRVRINPNTVDVSLEYSIRVVDSVTQSSKTYDLFSATLQAKLGRMLDFARRFMLAENRDAFLEKTTIDLMATTPNIPLDGLEFSCRRLEWRLGDIQKNLSLYLEEMIPQARVRNTDHYPFEASESTYERLRSIPVEDVYAERYPGTGAALPVPDDAYVYNHLFYNVTAQRFDDLSVNIDYKSNWGLNIYARPSRNGYLRSNSGPGYRKYLSYLCVNQYHFTYDINYPVVVSMYDDAAFAGEGYWFRFAIPVIIAHNEPNRQFTTGTTFYNPTYNAEFCADNGTDTYTVKVMGNENGYVNVELADVAITYDCYKYECPLGKTGGEGVFTQLQTKIPSACFQGFIVANKEGYLESRTQLGTEQQITLPMTKIKNMSLIIEKYDSRNLAAMTPVDDTDAFVISMLPVGIDTAANAYVDNSTVNPMVQLVDGDATYEINIYTIDPLDEAFKGGYVGNWTYAYTDIIGKDTLVLKTVEYLPRQLDEQGQADIVNFLETNTSYVDLLRPELR